HSQQRTGVAAHSRRLQSAHVGRPALVRTGILRAEQRLHALEIAPRVLDPHARIHPSDAAEKTGVTVLPKTRPDLRRDPDVDRRRGERARYDADDGVAGAADDEPESNRRGAPAEPSGPHAPAHAPR